jgi:hypothetical protein
MSPVSRLVSVAALSTGPPFPLALVAYFGFGFGTGLGDAGWNLWSTTLPRVNVIQGLLHGQFFATSHRRKHLPNFIFELAHHKTDLEIRFIRDRRCCRTTIGSSPYAKVQLA